MYGAIFEASFTILDKNYEIVYWNLWIKWMETMVWDLELCSFIRVAAIDRLLEPSSIFFWIWAKDLTVCF